MIGVITLTTKVGKANGVIQYHRYDIFHIISKCSLGYKPRSCVGHYDPSGDKPPGHFEHCFMQKKVE